MLAVQQSMSTTTRQTLAQALTAADLNQRQLAQKIDTSETHVSRWLRGVHTPNRFYRKEIARALGLKVDQISWGSE